MKILVLDTIHGGAVLAEALLRHGDEVMAVDVYRGGVPSMEEVQAAGFDIITAPAHLDPDFPLLKAGIPVITHHEMTARLAEEYPTKLIEITGSRGKTTTAFAVASVLPGKGILHTSAGTFLYPEKEMLFRKSITPASLLFALDAAQKKGAEWVVAEESIGVSGTGILGILTSRNDYTIASGKKSALDAKLKSLGKCRRVLMPEDVTSAVMVDGCRISTASDSFENPLAEIPVYKTAMMIAAAAAEELSLPIAPLADFSAVPGRMNLYEEEGVLILDNANSGTTAENTKEAAEYLKRVSGKPLVLVIGEGAHAVCEGFKNVEETAAGDFVSVVIADGRPFEELKAEGIALARKHNAALLLAVKTWR